MKISIVVRVLAPYAVPRYRALQSLGLFDFEVLALSRSEAIRDWKVAVEECGFPYREVVPGRCVDEVRPATLRRALTAYLEARDPDAVAVAGYGDRVIRAGLIWCITRKKITVLISDSTALDRRQFRPKNWLKALLVRRCDAGFVAGERAALYLTALGMPCHQIWRRQNVVDNEWFSRKAEVARLQEWYLRDSYGLPHRYFLYVGRFAPEKNLLRLLDAYGRYRDQGPAQPWGLVLLGSGPEREGLEGYVRRNHLPDVVWTGSRQIDELPAFYALAGCLVLPSLSEAWGLVVNEAMASGLPVLVSDRCGCVPELVHQGLNGYVFDPSNVDELARLMGLMASGQVDLKAMGEESRRAIAPYSPEAWALSLADCLQQAAARKKRVPG